MVWAWFIEKINKVIVFKWFWLVLLFLLLFTAFSSLGCLPPPAGISYSIPMQNWCKTLSWLPFSSCGHFWFNSNSKVMQNPLLVAFLLLWSFLIQFRFRIDGKSNIGCLPPPVLAAFLLLWSFLIQFLFRIDAKSSLGCLPPPVVISYSILIQTRCKILSWLPSSSCVHFLFKSYAELI